MPDNYNDYLSAKYPGGGGDLDALIKSVDGQTGFFELALLFRQIRNFRGNGIAAKLYYESKVAEALALIIEKRAQEKPAPVKSRYRHDFGNLSAVTAYIDEHFASAIRLEDLSPIAGMGATKLKSAFKQVYHCTITEYIQNRRMNRAEYLLSNTDMPIRQIALQVGYRDPGRFSELFHRIAGSLPNEYRRLSLFREAGTNDT